MTDRLVFNGKFLNAPQTGVQRVAHELIFETARLLQSGEDFGVKTAVIYAPGNLRGGAGHDTIPLVKGGLFSGRVKDIPWEQFSLGWFARRDLLVNLCNLGPVLHKNSITMIHDAQVFLAPESYSAFFRRWYGFIHPALGRSSRMILTVSEYSKQQLVKFGVAKAEKITVIHNGIDHVLRVTPDDAYPATAGLRPQAYVLALSNTQKHKNIAVLLQAFASPRLRDVDLVLFGSATRADFERLGHPVTDNVKFVGRVSDAQLTGLIRQARAFACPSLTEGFGMPPLEAMALDCPAIVAPCGALPEVCGDGALYAAPDQAEAWIDHIVNLATDGQLAEQMRARGRTQAQQFTWERAGQKLMQVIRDVGRGRAD